MTDQLTRDDLKAMSADAINKARQEGRLDCVLGIRGADAPEPASGPGGLTADMLAEMSPEALDILIEQHRSEEAAKLASTRGSADQGARRGPPKGQLARADIEGMAPEEINRAREEGRLDRLLGRER